MVQVRHGVCHAVSYLLGNPEEEMPVWKRRLPVEICHPQPVQTCHFSGFFHIFQGFWPVCLLIRLWKLGITPSFPQSISRTTNDSCFGKKIMTRFFCEMGWK